MEILYLPVLFVIGLTGLAFGMITAYPLDKLKSYPIWRVATSLALTSIHVCIWMLFSNYMETNDLSVAFENIKSNSYFRWLFVITGSLTVMNVHLDKRADRPFIPKFLSTLFSRKKKNI